MYKRGKIIAVFLAAIVLSFPASGITKRSKQSQAKGEMTGEGPAVLWRDPTDIAARNLYYGPGGEKNQPHGPYTFVKEDLDGSNPKFVVRDRDGVKWKVKLGLEARPETVATRLVWAVGYFANEDYFIPSLRVKGMPPRLHRGQNLIAPDGSIPNVRLKREEKDEKKIAYWRWRDDPFNGTRELNGLKIMMSLVNNWDLKDSNNAVYQAHSEQVYVVSDLGASFGSPGYSWPKRKSRGDLNSYSRSQFIDKVTPEFVDFHVPTRPALLYAVALPQFISRLRLRGTCKQIPRSDARWMGQMLGRLSPRQIRDAFRAAGYSPLEVEGYSRVVEYRIVELQSL